MSFTLARWFAGVERHFEKFGRGAEPDMDVDIYVTTQTKHLRRQLLEALREKEKDRAVLDAEIDDLKRKLDLKSTDVLQSPEWCVLFGPFFFRVKLDKQREFIEVCLINLSPVF